MIEELTELKPVFIRTQSELLSWKTVMTDTESTTSKPYGIALGDSTPNADGSHSAEVRLIAEFPGMLPPTIDVTRLLQERDRLATDLKNAYCNLSQVKRAASDLFERLDTVISMDGPNASFLLEILQFLKSTSELK